MKFEGKLNKMHSDFRDLTTKSNKAEKDFYYANLDKNKYEALLNAKSEELTKV